MLLSEARAVVERAAQASTLGEALPILRELSLDDFGLVMFDPPAYRLEHLLPSMPSAEIQKRWMGRAGHGALQLSLPFMRTLESLHARFRHRPLHGASILDYGSGWGRLLRLALYYSDPERLTGADAWEGSLDFARNLPMQMIKVDTEPKALNLGPVDVAYAFSVFTHLPQEVARAVLNALRGAAEKDALLVFTFCPIEQWETIGPDWFKAVSREELKTQHKAKGYAYHPSPQLAKYGWATMSHAYLERMLEECGWKRMGFDGSLADPYQSIVAAQPIV